MTLLRREFLKRLSTVFGVTVIGSKLEAGQIVAEHEVGINGVVKEIDPKILIVHNLEHLGYTDSAKIEEFTKGSYPGKKRFIRNDIVIYENEFTYNRPRVISSKDMEKANNILDSIAPKRS